MAYKQLASIMCALLLVGSAAERAHAAGTRALSPKLDQLFESGIQKAHGFHCRAELGWNPMTGYYQFHRHEKICRNFNRCLAVHRRCIRIYARGWNSWEYEKWGWDNWKYTSCMIDNDCY